MLGLQGYADSSDEEAADAGTAEAPPAEEDEPSPSSANLLQALASPQPNGKAEEEEEVEEPVVKEADPEDVSKGELPKEPDAAVSADRLANVKRLLDLQAQGRTINAHMKSSAEYRNPYILEKIIKVFEIDETATHVPAELYDPAPAVAAIGYYDDTNFGKPRKRPRVPDAFAEKTEKTE